MTSAELTGTWTYPTRILFGADRIAELPEACRALGMTRPLLVTDPGLAALPLVREAIAASRESEEREFHKHATDWEMERYIEII